MLEELEPAIRLQIQGIDLEELFAVPCLEKMSVRTQEFSCRNLLMWKLIDIQAMKMFLNTYRGYAGGIDIDSDSIRMRKLYSG